MNIKYTFANDNAGLNKIQDKAIRAANNARNLIQLALVATVHHLAQNHDVNVARRLIDGLHETVRGKALVEFLAKYGHLTVGEQVTEVDGKEVKTTTFTGIKGNAEEHSRAIRETFDECKETMWWTLKRENPYKGFDMQQALNTVINQYQTALKRIAEGKADNDKLSTEVNDKTIRALLAIVKFDIIEPVAGNDDEALHANAA